MVAIPRIGQEVIVDFLEGDPDQPVITGRLYNAEQMPPYALPANMTQSGILSRSTKTGHGGNANEFRFEDKKGQELVFIHAEKNMTAEVEADDSQTVGANRSINVGGTHTENIKKDMTINVTEGQQETTVMNDIIITTEAGAVKISSPKEITLLVGASTIMITPDHIVIDSPRVDINPGGMDTQGPAKKLAQIMFPGVGGGGSAGGSVTIPPPAKPNNAPHANAKMMATKAGGTTEKKDDAPKKLTTEQKKQVEQALAEQRKLLENKKASLERWNDDDKASFKKAFGTTANARSARDQSGTSPTTGLPLGSAVAPWSWCGKPRWLPCHTKKE